MKQLFTFITRITYWLDFRIIDTCNDLNVYIDTLPDGTQPSSNGTNSDMEKFACCASTSAQDGNCCSEEKKASGCCGPDNNSNGCCTNPERTGEKPDPSSMAAELGDFDLNQWVGKCCPTSKLWSCLIPFRASRLVHNTRAQALNLGA